VIRGFLILIRKRFRPSADRAVTQVPLHRRGLYFGSRFLHQHFRTPITQRHAIVRRPCVQITLPVTVPVFVNAVICYSCYTHLAISPERLLITGCNIPYAIRKVSVIVCDCSSHASVKRPNCLPHHSSKLSPQPRCNIKAQGTIISSRNLTIQSRRDFVLHHLILPLSYYNTTLQALDPTAYCYVRCAGLQTLFIPI